MLRCSAPLQASGRLRTTRQPGNSRGTALGRCESIPSLLALAGALQGPDMLFFEIFRQIPGPARSRQCRDHAGHSLERDESHRYARKSVIAKAIAYRLKHGIIGAKGEAFF